MFRLVRLFAETPRFMSHGDFSFPLTWPYYINKQFYIWSFRNGTPNPDGIIKMPGRLPEVVIFMLFGSNTTVSYFFIFSSLALMFAAFYLFTAKFLHIKKFSIKFIGALFYTINPVTLGNLAKTGLILAAAMLPLSLVAIRLLFAKKQARYLLAWIICLNISLIHPFTFIVNAAVSGGYFLYVAWEHKPFLRARWKSFVLYGGIGLLLCAYFLLPILSMRTLSKDVINDSAAATPTDYSAMVEILSTRDLLTGFSLSKDVVIDFAYYGGPYTVLYFVGIAAFYMLIFGLYSMVEKRLSDYHRRLIIVLMAAFLVLILLATVTIWNIDSLIKLLIQLPGGWAFRSPLKWQLYIPMALITILVILLSYFDVKRWRRLLYGGLCIIFVLMNSYLLAEIYSKLLTPRAIVNFQSLEQREFTHQNILLISSDKCASTDMANRRIRTELKQILVSKDVQIKQISPAKASTLNLGNFDYIMDCRNLLKGDLQKEYDFKLTERFADNMFQFWENQKAKPFVYAAPTLFATPAKEQGGKYAFATDTLKTDYDFLDSAVEQTKHPVTHLIDPYEELSFGSIQEQAVHAATPLPASNTVSLYVRPHKKPLYYQYDQDAELISFSTEPTQNYQVIEPSSTEPIAVEIPADNTIDIAYHDSDFTYKNILPNSSFDTDLWQKKVSDCYPIDEQPDIGMHNQNGALELTAKNHIACTGPGLMPASPGAYLLGFDFKSQTGKDAGVSVLANRPDQIVLSERLRSEPNKWSTFTDTLSIPERSDKLRLRVHAFPDTPLIIPGQATYDNFKLVGIPDIQQKFYFVGKPAETLEKPQKITYTILNPTKSSIRVTGARTPFYLMTKETYSDQWQLLLGNHTNSWLPFTRAKAVGKDNHMKVNGAMNAWYIDPQTLCKDNAASCTKNEDGSYDISFVNEFITQRWLNLGVLISGITLIVCVSAVIYLGFLDWQKKGYRIRL